VAGEQLGKEARAKGAKTGVDGFRAVQGHAIEEASAFWCPFGSC
jgi:hypothetical protein